MFIPGETIQHRFYTPFKAGDIAKIYVSYRQCGNTILIKTVNPGNIVDVAGESLSHFNVSLTQQESLLFQDNEDFFVQLNVVLVGSSNTRCVSAEIKGSNGLQHMRGVVTKNGY